MPRRGEEGGYQVQQRGETVMGLWNEEEKLKKPTEEELKKIEDASRTVKDDATKTADQRAAAEIVEQIAKKQIAAREEALLKLEKKFENEAKKAKRFNETSM